MQTFLQQVKDPGWWLGVVVVSFLVNIGSSYARSWIDRGRAKLGMQRTLKTKEREAEEHRELEKLRQSGKARRLSERLLALSRYRAVTLLFATIALWWQL